MKDQSRPEQPETRDVAPQCRWRKGELTAGGFRTIDRLLAAAVPDGPLEVCQCRGGSPDRPVRPTRLGLSEITPPALEANAEIGNVEPGYSRLLGQMFSQGPDNGSYEQVCRIGFAILHRNPPGLA